MFCTNVAQNCKQIQAFERAAREDQICAEHLEIKGALRGTKKCPVNRGVISLAGHAPIAKRGHSGCFRTLCFCMDSMQSITASTNDVKNCLNLHYFAKNQQKFLMT